MKLFDFSGVGLYDYHIRWTSGEWDSEIISIIRSFGPSCGEESPIMVSCFWNYEEVSRLLSKWAYDADVIIDPMDGDYSEDYGY
jgi:hypothetical protein